MNHATQLEETDTDRRRSLLDDNALTVDLVSALAGDRPLTKVEHNSLDDLKKIRGLRIFSDLLYAITHQYFPPETAEKLWLEVLDHKIELSTVLKRNVRTVVAALDYLSNITGNMRSTTLVGEAVIEEIVALSLRDGLTGLFNHTYLFHQIDLEVQRYARYGALVSLVLIDIDSFKNVNDTCGHQEGDRILAAMGRTLACVARGSDICCRYGGEEYAVILPLTNIHEASKIAGRLKTEMAKRLSDGRTVTVIMGVASCEKLTRTHRDLVKKADDALYQAKKKGKNRVEVVTADRSSKGEHRLGIWALGSM
ncbi:MAG: diguanylate cyclase [Desulfobulbus sp.]|nr:diguanylate cyclase [Desulfobulbus sp.]